MISKKYQRGESLIFLCIASIFVLTLSDCPISYYPESTYAGTFLQNTGSIKAYVDSSTSKVKQQQYTYNLIEPLTSSSPKIAIMISSLSYRAWGNISFNIIYKATPSFSRLVFLVNVTEDSKNKWSYLQFSFIASENNIFELGSQNINNFTNTDVQSKKLVVSRLPIQNSYQKPVIKIFLNGLTVQSTIQRQEIDQIKTQIDGYRALTWAASVVKFLQKKLNQRQILQANLNNITLSDKSLSFFIQLGYKQTLTLFSFSYVIFSSNQVAYRNLYIQGRHNQTFQSFTNFASLDRMDLFFVGLQSFKFKQWEQLSLNPIFGKNQNNQTFTIKDSFLVKQNSFLMNYFAISKSKDNYCSHCRDGNIVLDNFCVSQCPQNYVKRFKDAGFYCEFCDIKQFKVTNKQKNQCMCALQYFNTPSIKNPIQFTCSSCNYKCLTCQSEYKCLTCDSNFFNTFRVINDKSQCICGNGYYDDGQNNIKCLKCHSSCLSCKGPSLYDCETCPIGKIKDAEGKCICEGNFADKNGTCLCESPNFNYKGNCFTFLSKNKCGENELQIIINNSTKCQCKPNFLRFKTTCILCKQNQRIQQQSGNCICKQNFFKNQSKGLCVACPKDKIYDSILSKCVCLKGTFESSDSKCIECNKKQTLINNQCRCVHNYFRNAWGECQRCKKQSQSSECKYNSK